MSKNGSKSLPEPKNVPWACTRPHWPKPKHIAAVEMGGHIFLECLKGQDPEAPKQRICKECRKTFQSTTARCPHCGSTNTIASGSSPE